MDLPHSPHVLTKFSFTLKYFDDKTKFFLRGKQRGYEVVITVVINLNFWF